MEENKSKYLIDEFIRGAKKTSSETTIVNRNPQSIAITLNKILGDHRDVLIGPCLTLDHSLLSDFIESANLISDPTENDFSASETGITDAFAGVSSTGSVCVTLQDRITSTISMLTKNHIVLLDSNTIVSQPRDILLSEKFSKDSISDSFTFITGPSATADMGPLVRGVHGPGNVHIVIIV